MTRTQFFRKPPVDCLSGRKVAADLMANLERQFRGVPSIYVVECTLRKSMVSLGDSVSVSDLPLPNPFTGGRGFDGRAAQVIGRTVNLLRGTVELTLSITDLGNTTEIYLSPSLVVTGWGEYPGFPNRVSIAQNRFSDGAQNDSDPFVADATVGHMVRFYSADHLYRSAPVRITGKSPTYLDLSATPALRSQIDQSYRGGGSGPPIATDLIELSDADDGAPVRAFSYMTEVDGTTADGVRRYSS